MSAGRQPVYGLIDPVDVSAHAARRHLHILFLIIV